MSPEPDRISCLMVTLPCPERFELLQRSVACFLAQTYSNRELVVVLDQGPRECVDRVQAYLGRLPGNVRVVQPAGKHTLGALRTLSLETSGGTVVCQWDDDDLSHPSRLAEQYRLLDQEDATAVVLQEVLHLFPRSRQIYWTNFRNTEDRCHAGTVMFRRHVRARWPAAGPRSNLGEDSAFLKALQADGPMAYLAGSPHLYVYIYHGNNACQVEHHRLLAESLSISRRLLEHRRGVFDQLACFDLGDGMIDVVGCNGLAFRIPGRRMAGEAAQGADKS
jgi:glycosyltransferase involved in cell wall biosynthesis